MAEYTGTQDVPRPSWPHPRFTRIQQRFLGLLNLHPRPDEQALPPARVLLGQQAHRLLLAQLDLPGVARSGPLFGTLQDGVARIESAPRGAAPCLSPEWQRPFCLDERYLLGWNDSLTQHGSRDSEWIGHWLIAPDNAFGQLGDHLRWIEAARRLALLDAQHFLLLLGEAGERVELSAYLWQGGEAAPLPVGLLPGGEV